MNISSRTPSKAGRLVLGAALLLAVALVISVADAQTALAQVDIEANNLLLNGSFEMDSVGDIGVPDDWFDNNFAAGDKRVCTQSYVGSCSFKMFGNTNYKWLVQCINVGDNPSGTQYKIKFWAKTKSLVIGGGQARIYIDFYDGGGFVDGDTFNVPGGTSPWTLYQGTATADAAYDSICVSLALEASSGKIWFDKVILKEIL